MTQVYSFHHTPVPPIVEVGGKAHSLMNMTSAGYTVPNGFVCGAGFFSEWNKKIEISKEWGELQQAIDKEKPLTQHTDSIKKQIKQFSLSSEQKTEIDKFLGTLNEESLYAVRSSSPEEDLEGSSFAGIYETILGVKKSDIKEAILKVFLSAFDDRVFAYKKAKGFLSNKVEIAVIIMEQIDSEIAGVGFSINPINNDYDEAVINANFGLGESVVSGIVSPDYFIIDKVKNSVISKTLGNKNKSVYLTDEKSGGTQEKKNDNSDRFSLTDEQAITIAQMIVKVENLYKLPIDIEWAYSKGTLYMIQARPITTHIPLPKDMQTKPAEKKRILWYDCSVLEGVTTNRPITTMTMDWTLNHLGNAMGRPYLGNIKYSTDGNPNTDIFFGKSVRIYMNFSQIFFLQSAKSMAGGIEEGDKNAAEALRHLDMDIYLPDKKFPILKWNVIIPFALRTLVKSHKTIWDWISGMMKPTKYYHDQYQPCAEEVLKQIKELRNSEVPLSKYLELSDKLIEDYTEKFLPSMLEYGKHVNIIKNLAKDTDDTIKNLIDELTMGLEGDEAVNLGIELYKLSRMIPQEEFTNLSKLTEKIRSRKMSDEFMQVWDKFIETHGARGPNEMEIANKRYGDDPLLAVQQMSTMSHASENPADILQKHIQRRDEAYHKLLELLSKKQHKTLQKSFEIVKLLGPARDTLKYVFVQVNHKIRELVLQEAEKLVENNRLDEVNDVFFLLFNQLSDPTLDLKEIVSYKKPEFLKASANIQAFPVFIDSRGRIPTAEETTNTKSSDDPNLLQGNGISRGIARGKVKVLKDANEKPIEKGDILVTYNTDPGWTPLFIGAEGIVLEVGAILQHGGVVAREYAKPCVAGIRNVTKKLKDGQIIEINGTTGTVKIIK